MVRVEFVPFQQTVKELNIYVKTDQQAAAVLPKFW